MNSNLPSDARERVFAAANQVFAESDRQTMPTVDQVRRLAKVDMHAATAAMREWRRQQTAQAAPIAVAVPEVVAKANDQAVAQLWTQAQELANQSLREAQSAWDAERTELDQLRVELSDAFELQADELEQAKLRSSALENEARETAVIAAAELQKLRDQLDLVRSELVAATTRAERAGATAAELEHRVADLRSELERAHADVDHVRAEIKRTTVDAEGLRNELATMKAKAEAADHAHQEHRKQAAKEAQRCADKVLAAEKARDAIAKEAGTARENTARLSGQIEALQVQNAALLETLRGKLAGNDA